MTIGRNEPCPCGSGKKYKKCCLEKQRGSDPQTPQDVLAELRQQMDDKPFASMEEAQAAADRLMDRRNNEPIADFCGLSPKQMYRFLHFPLESPDMAVFSHDITSPEAPVLSLFTLLSEAIGDKGLKATATGNLPQKFCRASALIFWGQEKYQERTRFGSIRTEMDFGDMHCFRLIMELAGLLRKYKGKFILSRPCRQLLAKEGSGAVYRQLFETYVRKFNWAYRDGYPEIGFLQQSFLFTLFLFHEYGEKFRPRQFYEDRFLTAFPALLKEVPEVSYQTREETVRKCYQYRMLENFGHFFGLLEINVTKEDILDRQYEIKKTPLLGQLVSFAV